MGGGRNKRQSEISITSGYKNYRYEIAVTDEEGSKRRGKGRENVKRKKEKEKEREKGKQ